MAQVRTMVTFSGLDSATHAWNLVADQGGGGGLRKGKIYREPRLDVVLLCL